MFGTHTDIGADEYAPPSVLGESAPSITARTAVPAGSVNTDGPDQTLKAARTGLRARALKKCKKKHSARARKKCRRRAKRLPL